MGEAAESFIVRELRGKTFLNLKVVFLRDVSFHYYESVVAEKDG